MTVRSQKEGGIPYDPFRAFFHRQKIDSANPATDLNRPVKMKGAGFPPNHKLDINAASSAELENISGLGPAMAERIIAARPFRSADDLRSVKGIGDAKYAKIRPYFN
jgi:competence protein ComEA